MSGLESLSDPSDFDRFWEAYPKHVAKKEAQKAWAKLSPDAALVDAILAALAWQVRSPQWQKDRGQFVPYPASWLRAERWKDEPPLPDTLPVVCRICGHPEARYHSQVECNTRWLEQQKATPVGPREAR